MAITNQDRVGKALELLKARLGPFVEREVQNKIEAGRVRLDVIRCFWSRGERNDSYKSGSARTLSSPTHPSAKPGAKPSDQAQNLPAH